MTDYKDVFEIENGEVKIVNSAQIKLDVVNTLQPFLSVIGQDAITTDTENALSKDCIKAIKAKQNEIMEAANEKVKFLTDDFYNELNMLLEPLNKVKSSIDVKRDKYDEYMGYGKYKRQATLADKRAKLAELADPMLLKIKCKTESQKDKIIEFAKSIGADIL